MFGQSPYIINAYLVYNNPDLGLDVNLTYNISGPKIIVNVKGGTPDIYAQPYNLLNLTASKNIGERFLVEFRWKNILNGALSRKPILTMTENIYTGNLKQVHCSNWDSNTRSINIISLFL